MSRVLVAALTAMLLGGTVQAGDADPRGIAFFEKSIRPVLVAECYKCHSTAQNKAKGELVLDSESGLLTGGESGPAVVPGHPEESLLIGALRHEDFEMPPNKKLSEATIADFAKWIRMGAPYPKKRDAGPDWAAERKAREAEARNWWSFEPIADPRPPRVQNEAWVRDDLDRFVLRAQEAAGVTPVGDADNRTLIRRLYFDLIGLPPTPEQVTAFMAEAKRDRSAAIAKVVDELLESPRFGEKWGRHWLDVARYAESNGNVDNELFPHAWRYRDWVIDAFNRDMPWDRFILEQIAGDLLPYDSPEQRNSQLIATGFLALTSKPRPQGNRNYVMDLVADQIDTTTVAFMALTVGCARCHDHKFDPIPTAEYYKMASFFESTQMMHGSKGRRGNNISKAAQGGLLQLVGTDESSTAAVQRFESQKQELQKELSLAQRRLTQLTRTLAKKAGNGKGVKKLTAAQKKTLATARRRVQALRRELASLEKDGPSSGAYCMGVRDRGRPVEGRIRLRGDSTTPGEVVGRGFTTIGFVGEPPTVSAENSGRLELASWIASPQNTLTARVAVNRVWRHLFGVGIVKSVDNFGHLGERPTHPDLLDHLATRFMQEGWSVKQLIRRIVLSHTYQLASDFDAANFQKDPDNNLLWRHNVRRLDAEMLRDAVLLVSGSLDLNPPHGSIVAQAGAILVQNGNQKRFSQYDDAHRSAYLPIVRDAEPEMLHIFDFPDPELVVGDRSVTNVPAQSLFFMNSPFIVEHSRRLAKRVLASVDGNGERIDTLYQIVFSRNATADEHNRISKYLSQAADSQESAWAEVCQAALASAEFRYNE